MIGKTVGFRHWAINHRICGIITNVNPHHITIKCREFNENFYVSHEFFNTKVLVQI